MPNGVSQSCLTLCVAGRAKFELIPTFTPIVVEVAFSQQSKINWHDDVFWWLVGAPRATATAPTQQTRIELFSDMQTNILIPEATKQPNRYKGNSVNGAVPQLHGVWTLLRPIQ
jgi:hypothetical protein